MNLLESQFPASNFSLLAIVLGLPALGAFVNGVFGKRLGKDGVRLMALVAVGGSFVASVLTFLMLPRAHEGGAAARLTWNVWHWFSVTGRMGQSVPIDVAFSVDAMTATMMLIVTGVGFLIHLYSTEYMRADEGYHRFFAYLNLFIFAMLVLITGDSLAVLFVGWEGVGLCSYLLIGFWFTVDTNASAGKKAFIVNRIGDFGLIVAMAMLVYYSGTLRWEGIEANAQNLLQPVRVWPIGNMSAETMPGFLAKILLPAKPVQVYASTLVGLALFLGCAGKSAQIPLYVWLPDAMAGPTPVSALIHAATMVTAGVYLVARLSFVFVLSPAAMATIAVIGVATAIFAASIGLFQNDLKKILAYSTVSQLGFMFIGVGVGAFTAGIFHVVTHAFFKACLFLCAGSVIFAMHERVHDTNASQDIRNMGGLRHYMPITWATFLVSCCAIAGFPLTSGFWSKDEILWKAFSTHLGAPTAINKAFPMWEWPPWLGQAIYWVGILAATMTALYMFRAYFLVFHGPFRGWTIVRGWRAKRGHDEHEEHAAHEHPGEKLLGPRPKESPAAMTIPLGILAFFAAIAGFLYAAPLHSVPFEHLLEPVFEHARTAVQPITEVQRLEGVMLLPGIAAFLIGTAIALVVYLNRGGAPELTFARTLPGLYRLIVDKWRIDELYDATIVGMVDALADIFTMADKWIVDGIIAKLTAALTSLFGTLLRALQTGRMQVYAASMVVGLAGLGFYFIKPHAAATVDDRNLKSSGQVVIAAAPGLGYQYRWDGSGVPAPKDFSDQRELTVSLNPGDTKDVVLYVKNAFNGTDAQRFQFNRPALKHNAGPAGVPMPTAPNVPELPSGPIPLEKVPDLLLPGSKPGGAQ